MAESKKNLKIRFEGRLDNLVINYGGKVIYSYKREKKKETGKTDKQKAAQAKTAITAELCSYINKIPALKYIWKQWPDKERKPYRNMLAANIRKVTPERLTVYNMVAPRSQYDVSNLCKSIDISGITFNISYSQYGTIETETGKPFSIIVIICLYNPLDKSKPSYKLFTLCMEKKNFKRGEVYDDKFPFDSEEQMGLIEYGNCIIYCTVVFDELAGGPRKWFSMDPTEYILTKGKGEINKGLFINRDAVTVSSAASA